MVKLRMGRLDRVAPFVKNMVDTLCPVGTLIRKTEELTLGYGKNKGTILEELAYNGLCRGHQQLYWQKDFIESALSDSKEWIDSGVLVVEESSGVVPMIQRDQILSGITDAKNKDAVEVGSGAVAKTTSASTLGKGSDKDSETTSEPVDSKPQSETVNTSGSTAKHVPLQVRFLHKIIQEWFAANHFAFTILKYRDESLLERYVNEQLVFIDPSDLHFVLRFTVALYPPCCQLIIKYLLRGYRSKEGSIPEHIIDCIFLCFAEYDGEIRRSTLNAVAEVCKEEIVIIPENSRLLQQAKVRMLELASKCGILTRKLILSDVVVSASDDALEFTSGIMMEVLDTLEEIEIIDRNGILEEDDYTNVLKFNKNCALIKEACLNFPNEPPWVDKETVRHFGEDEKTVLWKLGSKETQTLNTTKGEWMVESEMCSLTSETDKDADFGWDEHTILESEGTLSTRGGVIEISKTGVRLYIPQGALQEGMDPCTIRMKIIPPDSSDKTATDFSRNSSVIVELLPDILTFQHPVRLTLPHCYQLKEGKEHKATIFMSHHKEGIRPSWEEKADQPHHLTNTTCTILLDRLGWVKYDIDCRIVDGKRIQVYAAGKHMSYLDKSYETVLGYYPDVPGGGQVLRSNHSLVVASKQSFLFYKEGSEPLKFLLQKVIPQQWNSHQVEENLKEIPFECIALDEERSCSFVFLKTSQEPLIPMLIFRVLQGSRGVRLLDRPEVLKNLLDAENSSAARVSIHSQESLQPFLGVVLQKTMPRVEAIITQSSATVTIPGTKVVLIIPQGSLPGRNDGCLIKMRIIPRKEFVDPEITFSSNSSVVVEILPNNIRLQCPAQLLIPHCLLLKEKETPGAKIFISHHAEGCCPCWVEHSDLKYSVEKTHCVVWLNSFCWVTIKVDDKDVLAKNLILYTSGKKLIPTDEYAQTEVGYYPDLDGEAKVLSLNERIIVYEKKPFVFMKEGSHPLCLLLEKFSEKWTLWLPGNKYVEIAFVDISSSFETTRTFIFQKTGSDAKSLLCLFTASQQQGQQAVNLAICPEKLEAGRDFGIHIRDTSARRQTITLDSDTDNVMITFLSRNIRDEWMNVGRRLTVPEAKLSSIKADNVNNRQECIYQMLLFWKGKKGPEATFDMLAEALTNADRTDLSERVKKFAELFE